MQLFNSRNLSRPERTLDEVLLQCTDNSIIQQTPPLAQLSLRCYLQEKTASTRGAVTAFSRPVQKLWGHSAPCPHASCSCQLHEARVEAHHVLARR